MFDELTLRSDKCLAHLEELADDVLAATSEREYSNNSRLSLVSLNSTSSSISSARSTRDSILELYARTSYLQQILVPRENSFQEAPEFQGGTTDMPLAASGLEELVSHEMSKTGMSCEMGTSVGTMGPVGMSYGIRPNTRSDESQRDSIDSIRELWQIDPTSDNRRLHIYTLLRNQGDRDLAELAYASDDPLYLLPLLHYIDADSNDIDVGFQAPLSKDGQQIGHKPPRLQVEDPRTKKLAVIREEDYKSNKGEPNTYHAVHLIVITKSIHFAAICLRKSPAISVKLKRQKPFEYFSSCEEDQVSHHTPSDSKVTCL